MSDLTATEARRLLRYEAETGHIYWRVRHCLRICAGSLAGSLERHGYRVININNKKYRAHRVAWLLHYGEWPTGQIDHINRDRCDNRLVNLRIATASQNCRNKDKRARGVSFHKKTGKWQVQICLPLMPPKYIGLFESESEALCAYKRAAKAAALL